MLICPTERWVPTLTKSLFPSHFPEHHLCFLPGHVPQNNIFTFMFISWLPNKTITFVRERRCLLFILKSSQKTHMVHGPEQSLKHLLDKQHMCWHCLLFTEPINLAKGDCQSWGLGADDVLAGPGFVCPSPQPPVLASAKPHPPALGLSVWSHPQLKLALATKMARPFIALEAATTSWVGRQGFGLPLYQGLTEKLACTPHNV